MALAPHSTARSVVDSETLDLSTSTTSKWFSLHPRDMCSLQVVWTGLDAPDGTWKIEVTNDERGDVFSTLPDSTGAHFTVTAQVAEESHVFDVISTAAKYIRVRWTANSVTTGEATINYVSKNRGR